MALHWLRRPWQVAFAPFRTSPKSSPRGGRKGRAKSRAVSRPSATRWAGIIAGVTLLAAMAEGLGLPAYVSDRVIGPPSRFDLSGIPNVSDGDTLTLGRTRIRLEGIDAPERDQVCYDTQRQPIACGRTASQTLIQLTRDGVSCISSGKDRYDRVLATCYTQGRDPVDIAGAMVRAGWALAYRRYSNRYVLDENLARAESAGLWALDFETPEEHRHSGS